MSLTFGDILSWATFGLVRTDTISSPDTPIGQMRQDTVNILSTGAIGSELFIVKRSVEFYDGESKATITWTQVETFNGDWQPVDGNTIRAEEGLADKSDAVCYGPYGIDVLGGDRIYRADGSYEYINYVRPFDEHTEIFVTKTKGD
ncbi:MAG: hypothetical protein KAS32_25985 [Candidatus Peribacteraceae bacterium]|nr:hypothetical protein [Candidatus Peribacteraceae bacterium]